MKEKARDPRIKSLISEVAKGRQADIIGEMIETVLRFGKDKTGLGELKLYNRAIRELRYASTVFGKYQGIRKVAVFGSARTSPEAEEYKHAREFSRRMVEHDELARLTVFLTSDLARCITGQFILADAGAFLSRTRPRNLRHDETELTKGDPRA